MFTQSWKSVYSELLINLAAPWIASVYIELQNLRVDIPSLLFRSSSVIVCLIIANLLRKEAA